MKCLALKCYYTFLGGAGLIMLSRLGFMSDGGEKGDST